MCGSNGHSTTLTKETVCCADEEGPNVFLPSLQTVEKDGIYSVKPVLIVYYAELEYQNRGFCGKHGGRLVCHLLQDLMVPVSNLAKA